MIRNIALAFIALVMIFFVTKYPHQVIALIQMFVDAAYQIANALGQTNITNGGR